MNDAPTVGADVQSASRRQSGGPMLAVLLTLPVAMGPVSTDLYLPSLPGIAADLGAPDTAGAFAPFPERAGAAAALLGFLQMMTGLVVNALSSLAFGGTPRPMATLNAACALRALFSFWLVVRRRTRPAMT